MFPFHTWLPDAHTEAPTVGSVVAGAVLLKMGTYGFIRFAIRYFRMPTGCDLVDLRACVIGIIYGAWVAMVQVDVKRLVAFSSVSPWDSSCWACSPSLSRPPGQHSHR